MSESVLSTPLKISNVAVPVADGVAPFELGVACELFGLDRSDQGLPGYEFDLASVTGRSVRSTAGFTISTAFGLDRLAEADLIVLVAGSWVETPPHPQLVQQLYAARDRGAHIMAICRGAFVLAAAGLLDGLPATTHWRWTDEMARRYPLVRLDPDVLYVDTGDVSTSAGTAAGIDLGLHLLRRAHGATIAAEVARRMVVPTHRDGGQAQYLRLPQPDLTTDDPVSRCMDWAVEHLDEAITINDLARQAQVAPRTIARMFHDIVGVTPYQWMIGQRLALAQQLLETSTITISTVARRSGFGSADTLRLHFTRHLGTTPAGYRQKFGVRPSRKP
ncbi:MAG TPA: helix-turn-helix domain-containing protein [Candidatus Limnocylindrales bacterium]